MQKRRKGYRGLATLLFGNAVHRWMWDKHSLANVLTEQGFVCVEPFVKNKCEDKMFLLPEEDGQFHNAIALQSRKPGKNISKM